MRQFAKVMAERKELQNIPCNDHHAAGRVLRSRGYYRRTGPLGYLLDGEKAKSDLGLSGHLSNLASESGLYKLAMLCDKNEARDQSLAAAPSFPQQHPDEA